jgi:hypothetical protein
LKTVYYFKAFGIGVGVLDLSGGDYLLESWFVVQNVLFFVLLWWIALRTRLRWVGAVGACYSLIPIASHYAFAFHDSPLASFLIQYRHTLLKLIPFGVLVVVWSLHPQRREPLKTLRWTRGPGAAALCALITLAWAVSTSKHCGSFDANLALSRTADHLAKVRIRSSVGTDAERFPGDDAELYLLYAGETTLVVWDRSNFRYGSSTEIRTWILDRSSVDWIEVTAAFDVQPGRQFL